ncbi:MAG: hypothetical protein MNPFHGCM_01789 [Gemmatimonadaceae bacterium]|nr:hypothetical protein [Gemmatimonadaceae bacterium]
MPRVQFARLPDDARVWVFGASDPVVEARAHQLLERVDAWLDDWQAHGEPLTCARDWRDDRFLVIGVDERAAGASGCSIDALFHVLLQAQSSLGATIVGGGRVYYRDRDGVVQCTSRSEFPRLRAAGVVDERTIVFDTTVTRSADYRRAFEQPLGASWHRDLV